MNKQQTKAIKQARAIKQNIINDFDPDSFTTNDDLEADNMEYLARFAYARTVMDNSETYYNVN